MLVKNLFVFPHMGDGGLTVGAASNLNFNIFKKSKISLKSVNYGPSYDDNEIKQSLKKYNKKIFFKKFKNIKNIVVEKLIEKKVVGFFQGRMEFGPRALGSRSIIADPRSEKMQKNLNLKVKFRESFRPFAPSVIREDLSEWFTLDSDSPYMLLVADINGSKKREMTIDEKKLFGIKKLNIKRSEIPAVTHVDYSARIQTVHANTNKKYYNLLKNFKKITNCSVIVNTSFNV